MRGSIRLRRNAQRLLEAAVAVIGTQANGPGESAEFRLLASRLDQPAGPRDFLRMDPVERDLVWLASLAGSKARPLSLVSRVEEAHVGALGQAGGATGAAINAGGLHRNVELACKGCVAGDHSLPPRI